MAIGVEKIREIELHDRLVDEYDRRHGSPFTMRYATHLNQVLLSHLPVDAKQTVLDCGCGTGIMLKDLTRAYRHVIGLDLSLSMLKKIGNGVMKTTVGDGEHLPLQDNSVDIVVSRGCLHHLPSLSRALDQIHRILKPGGHLVMCEPNRDALLLRLPRTLFNKSSDRFNETHKTFSMDETVEHLGRAGFTTEHRRRFGFFGFPLCGLSDILPIMHFLPFREAFTDVLIRLDALLSTIPGIKTQAWQNIVKARKV